MKKVFAFVLSLMLLCTAAAAQATTASTGTVDGYDPNQAVEFTMHTSQAEPVYNLGEVDKALFEGPILLTSFGQSADSAMLEALMKRAKVTDYTFNATATADMIKNYKTIVIAAGASSKGLGAAGISESAETERAEAVVAAIKESGAKVICCHLGGSIRRGALSDKYTNMVLDVSSYALVVEDANFDGMFSNYAEAHSMPMTFLYGIVNGVKVFSELFAK